MSVSVSSSPPPERHSPGRRQLPAEALPIWMTVPPAFPSLMTQWLSLNAEIAAPPYLSAITI